MSEVGTSSLIDGETGLRLYECPKCGELSPIVGVAVGGPAGREQPFPILECGSMVQVATVKKPDFEE